MSLRMLHVGCQNMCWSEGQQREKLTLHKYLASDFHMELQFNRKVTLKAIVQKHWLKLTKSFGTLLVRVVVAVWLNGACSPIEMMHVDLSKTWSCGRSAPSPGVQWWFLQVPRPWDHTTPSNPGRNSSVPTPGQGILQWNDGILWNTGCFGESLTAH